MKTLISTIVLLALGQAAPRPAAPPVPTTPTRVQPSQQQSRSTGLATSPPRSRAPARLPGAGNPSLREQACATVLVVPTPELTSDNLAQITEDMTVMCRILDKAVAPNLTYMRPTRRALPDGAIGAPLDDDVQTQGLYLAGYGALFFVQVDFPLRAPAQPPEQVQAQEEPTTDPLWSQTVAELQGASPENPRPAPTTPPYDASKVENLKTALLKSLRHAANMRLASTEDFLTLFVGPEESWAGTSFNLPRAASYPGPARGGVVRRSGPAPAGGLQAQAESPAVLVLRAHKAQADAFAKGQLTLEQLTEKTQVFWSSANPGPTESAAPARLPLLQRR